MLDPATLALLAKLKVLAKKSGTAVDLIQMSENKTYAEITLNELSNSDDPELVMIVINLMNQFGMIKAPSAQAKHDGNGDADRYIGALR